MIKLIIKITILFVSSLAIIYFISKYDNSIPTKDTILNVNVGARCQNLDYIFVGSSYVYSGINTLIFDSAGFKSFNFGVATAGPVFSELIIDDYVKASGSKPKNIVMAISFSTFSDIASDGWDKYPIHRYLNMPLSNEYIFCKYVPTIQYVKLLRNSFKKGVRNIISRKYGSDINSKYQDVIMCKGFYPNAGTYSRKQYLEEKNLFLVYKKSNYSYTKEKLFFNLIDRYKKMGVNVILVEPPTFKLTEFYENEFKKRYEDFKIKCSGLNIDLVENTLEMDSTCFGNLDHLNYKGAGIYSHYLLERFNKLK